MTKYEKLEAIIKKDVSSGFMFEMEQQLRKHAPYVKKLASHPDFIPKVIDELVRKQMPYYTTVSEEAVDAAYDFFMSKAGEEWLLLSARFVNTINQWVPDFAKDVIRRLQNLN